jgi:hypothetical protein
MDTNLIDTNLYIFDINYYIKNNEDLYINGIKDEHSALNHWINNGKNENRNYRYINVQLDSYIKEFNKFIQKKIFTKEEAWDILLNISTKHQNIVNIKDEDQNEESKENIINNIEKKFSLDISNKNDNSNNNIEDFDWEYYIENNKDLVDNGINNKNDSINHWLHFGINENRKHRFFKKKSILINTKEELNNIDNINNNIWKKNINIRKKNINIRKKNINIRKKNINKKDKI